MWSPFNDRAEREDYFDDEVKPKPKPMKKVIWKFEFKRYMDNQYLELPLGYEVLSLQLQGNIPCLWVLVDPNVEKKREIFEIYGTGDEIRYKSGVDRKYIGTWQEQGGKLVWHLFQVILG